MEHIVQFGISIDDEAIKKRVEDKALGQVVSVIKSECVKELIGTENPDKYQYQNKMRQIIEEVSNDFFEKHKDEIINGACDKLAERLSRTKACREAVGNMLGELGL